MPTLKELRESRGNLNKKYQDKLNAIEKENRDATAEESAELNELHTEDGKLKARIDRQEIADKWNTDLASPAPGSRDLKGLGSAAGRGDREDPTQQAEQYNLAIQGWARNQMGAELSDREREACEAVKLNPERKALNIQLDRWNRSRAEYRNAMTTQAPSTGGTLIRPQFANTLEMAMLAHGPMLQVSTLTETGTGADIPFPTINDTSNEGELLGEFKTATSQDVTTGAVVLKAHQISSKVVVVSQPMLEDSEFDIPSMLASVFGERIGRTMNRQGTTGTGGGLAFHGAVTAATVGKTAASATAITLDEVLDLIHSIDPAYRSDPSFAMMMHDNVVLALRKLKDGQGQYLWQPSVQSGVPDKFGSVPVLVNQHMASAIATGAKTILCGAFRKYHIRRVRSVIIRRMTETYATQNADGFVAFVRADGGLLDAGTHPLKVLQQA